MGWGGLWTATDAEEFAANAVRMYTSEEEWHVWQQRGFELLNSLYNKADRLKTVQVLGCCFAPPLLFVALSAPDSCCLVTQSAFLEQRAMAALWFMLTRCE